MHTLDKEQKETWEENSWCLKVVGLWMIHLYIHSFWNCYNVHSIINKTWKGKHSSEAFSVPGRKISDAWDHFAFFLAPSKQPVIFIHMQGYACLNYQGTPPHQEGCAVCLMDQKPHSFQSCLITNLRCICWYGFSLTNMHKDLEDRKWCICSFSLFSFSCPFPHPPLQFC